MRFEMTVGPTGNAAMEDPTEMPRLLRQVADKIESGRTEGGVMDSNGNTVGQFLLDQTEDD